MNTPPLLLGAAIVFWGWLGTHLAIAVPLAIVFELARYVPWRFELSEAQQRRVADGNTLVLIVALALFYAAAGFPRAVVHFFLWLPVLLLPLALLQAVGSAREIDLRTLFWSLRRRELREPQAANLGYPWFLLWVVAASATGAGGLVFDAGLFLLMAWALWPWRPSGRRPGTWGLLLGVAGALGFAGALGLRGAQLWLEGAAPEWIGGGGTKVNPYRGTTDIGRFGELKLSDAIVMRLRPEFTLAPPLLLHQASYNTYEGGNWIARGGSFEPVAPTRPGTWRIAGGEATHAIAIDELARQGDPVLGLPQGTTEVTDFASPRLQKNPLGAVQGVADPGYVAYRARFDPGAGEARAPTEAELRIPERERGTLEQVAREWGLAGLPPAEALQRVRERFHSGFSYATFQAEASRGGRTPLADFLLRTRAGHCEHFASAATLLLRAAGIPARYATGYSVQEWSPLEGAWIVRERHSHAWTRAWAGGRWVDLDATPPTWLAIESQAQPAWGWFADRWSYARHRFARWAEAASGAQKATVAAIPLALLLLFSEREFRIKASVLPSGEKTGEPSWIAPFVSCISASVAKSY